MATTQIDILKQFCSVIGSLAGIPCVIGDQDAPPPKGSYICVRIIDTEVPTHDTTVFIDTTGSYQETVRGQSYCNMEVMIFGPPAMDNARKIMNGLQHSARQYDLWNTIGFGGFIGPQNLSEEYGGMFRQKAMFNLYFYVNLEYTETADYFNSATFEIIEPSLPYDKTITVP